jgi:hypothetical protein
MPEELQRQSMANSSEHELAHRQGEAYPSRPVAEEVRKRMTVFAECPDAPWLIYASEGVA